MNDLMSLGIHRLWKEQFLDWMTPRESHHLLDLAGGTGDIGLNFLKRGGGITTIADLMEVQSSTTDKCKLMTSLRLIQTSLSS